jgi:hypothetical protein
VVLAAALHHQEQPLVVLAQRIKGMRVATGKVLSPSRTMLAAAVAQVALALTQHLALLATVATVFRHP